MKGPGRNRPKRRKARKLKITPQEERVARLLCAKDVPNVKQLTDVLKISYKTVQTHIEKLYRKLGIDTRAALMREAIRLGWIPCPCPKCAPPTEGESEGGLTHDG